jgi:hypothetical protein
MGGVTRARLSLAHAATLRHYHDTRITLAGPLGATEYQNQWRPQDRFFGVGMGTSEGDRTDYATHIEELHSSVGYSWNTREGTGDPRTAVSAWFGRRDLATSRGREPGERSIQQVFPDEVAGTFDREVRHVVYGLRFVSDWRQGGPHWSKGWRILFDTRRYDRPSGWLSLGTASRPGAQFTRTTLELETGRSFMRDPRTLRWMGRIVDVGITSGADRMAVADLPSLGGREGLAGFEPGRFHDRDQVLTRVSYLFPLVRRLEIDLHVESGGVFSDLWRTSRLDRFQSSFGFALRGRGDAHPLGAIGLEFSRETTRLRYTLGNPE